MTGATLWWACARPRISGGGIARSLVPPYGEHQRLLHRHRGGFAGRLMVRIVMLVGPSRRDGDLHRHGGAEVIRKHERLRGIERAEVDDGASRRELILGNQAGFTQLVEVR